MQLKQSLLSWLILTAMTTLLFGVIESSNHAAWASCDPPPETPKKPPKK